MQTPILKLHNAGLSEADVERLVWLKHQIATGQRSEFTMEYKRLLFFRYLYEQGRLHD